MTDDHTMMLVTCIVTHRDGGTRRASVMLPCDNKPQQGKSGPYKVMNDTQAIGAAHTYGRRQAFCAVLGIVTADWDDDARACSPSVDPPAASLDDYQQQQANEPSAVPATPKATSIDHARELMEASAARDGISPSAAEPSITSVVKLAGGNLRIVQAAVDAMQAGQWNWAAKCRKGRES
jgi:hypothetical protein